MKKKTQDEYVVNIVPSKKTPFLLLLPAFAEPKELVEWFAGSSMLSEVEGENREKVSQTFAAVWLHNSILAKTKGEDVFGLSKDLELYTSVNERLKVFRQILCLYQYCSTSFACPYVEMLSVLNGENFPLLSDLNIEFFDKYKPHVKLAGEFIREVFLYFADEGVTKEALLSAFDENDDAGRRNFVSFVYLVANLTVAYLTKREAFVSNNIAEEMMYAPDKLLGALARGINGTPFEKFIDGFDKYKEGLVDDDDDFLLGQDLTGDDFDEDDPPANVQDALAQIFGRARAKNKQRSQSKGPDDKQRIEQFLKDWPITKLMKYFAEYIAGQPIAIRQFCIAVYEHLYRIVHPDDVYRKKSYVIFGPTGCGKTEIFRVASKILPVDVHILNATSITPAGYKGTNPSSMFKEMSKNSKYDYRYSVVFFDEFDKLCHITGDKWEGDAFHIEKQVSLLKYIEGTVSEGLDTTNMLFFCGGAFDGAFKERKKKTGIGFGAQTDSSEPQKDVITCLMDYGMVPELAGRINSAIPIKALTFDDMYEILIGVANSPLVDIQVLFDGVYGITLKFEEDALREVCDYSIKLQLGARSLHSILDGAAHIAAGNFDSQNVSVTKEHVLEYINNSASKEEYSRTV